MKLFRAKVDFAHDKNIEIQPYNGHMLVKTFKINVLKGQLFLVKNSLELPINDKYNTDYFFDELEHNIKVKE